MPTSYLISYLLGGIINLYLLIMVVRAVIDNISVFARNWRPRGVVLVIANIVYALTDPPLRFLRRFVPPLRLGAVSLDMAFLVLFLLLVGLQTLVYWIF